MSYRQPFIKQFNLEDFEFSPAHLFFWDKVFCSGGTFKLLTISVVDPNTLNLDPDPGFWPNLDPAGSRVSTKNFEKKKFKIILEKYNFL